MLVDEYDSPLTTSLNDNQLFTLIREDLSQFFSTIKSQDSAFRFIFITGITKFNKTSLFSAFNNLSDISLIPEYGDIVGYHHDEVKKYFSGYIEKAAKELEVDSEKLFDSLVRYYDGFCFEETAKIKVFAPWLASLPKNSKTTFLAILKTPQRNLGRSLRLYCGV